LAVLPLRFEGDPIPLQTAEPVVAFDDALATLVRDMFDTMYAAPGRGLAAPQVGASARVMVVDTRWKDSDPDPMIFVNPIVTARAQEEIAGEEACLSIPGKSFVVSRPAWVDMTWQDLDGVQHGGRFKGLQGVCVCHEFDHLDGLLITQTGVRL